jgi:heat shock protein HslJ
MKKQVMLLALASAWLGVNCGGTPKTQPEAAPAEPVSEAALAPASALPLETAPVTSFDSIKGTVWLLTEVKLGYSSIVLDRQLMSANQMGDYFTLQFVNEGINGRAAPNRYFAPYLLVDGNNVAIRPIAGTLMSSIINIGGLNEDRYYGMLQKISRWELRDNTLYVYSQGEMPGEELILVYKTS